MNKMKLAKLSLIVAATISFAGCSIVNLEPLSHKERQTFLQEDLKLQEKFNIAVQGPITLQEAMARTVIANIDHRVQILEYALSKDEFEQAKLQMLPNLTALGSITHRSPQSASRSVNLDTGEVSTGGYTSSEEKTRTLGDITFSYNLLDFGLSYYQAKQQADATLIRAEMQRSVIQNLLFKVRSAYWKAYFAQLFGPRIDKFLEESRAALKDVEQAQEQKVMEPLEALQYQKGLLSLISQMETLRTDMESSIAELRSLMNLPFDAPMQLVEPSDPSKAVKLDLPHVDEMIDVALDQRPECREAMYRTRASLAEVKKAYLKTLPGLEAKAVFNFDSNTYLRDNEWFSIWGNMTANVVDMLTAPQRIDQAKQNVELSEYRRLGMHMAVILQVQMATKELTDAVTMNDRNIEISKIDKKLNELVMGRVASNASTKMDAIKQEASTLVAELNQYKSYANVQNAYGALLNSMGLDMVDFKMENEPTLEDLSKLFDKQASVQNLNISEIVKETKEQILKEDNEQAQKSNK